MPDTHNIDEWPEKIRGHYQSYLRTSFYFKDRGLRDAFRSALQDANLMRDPLPGPVRDFKYGMNARQLAREHFSGQCEGLLPALINQPLYVHQESAIRTTHRDQENIVVATGTASGKTESFLYPILFELYRQHLSGELRQPGVRAMILYPMNALANDQRERLGKIFDDLRKENSAFEPKFGQYIGQTPESPNDQRRKAGAREAGRLSGELVFRDEMRETPPHILLTNYSMLEYLLIRPDDSPLFDVDRGKHWQFLVLDEAHQYRGTKGMEMGMLIRRLKQRLRDGGRKEPFRCIATSATLSSGEKEEEKQAVAQFGTALFGEKFSESGIIFGESAVNASEKPQRYHAFLRALEGAFLVHKDGKDVVALNRKREVVDGSIAEPLEIALCKECGQHYYVGRENSGKLQEAVRDPSQPDYGVDYYLPSKDAGESLCRRCGALSAGAPTCDCGASIRVKKCKPGKQADQLKCCEACGYSRGGIGDPVQEIVHGWDGPNAVIATTLHELLPKDRRKILAFSDNRQDAAFFAWYVQDSHEKLRDRNLLLRAIKAGGGDSDGLSVDDLKTQLLREWQRAGLFSMSMSEAEKSRIVLKSIFREALTDEKRLSLSGVGLIKWFVKIPEDLCLPQAMREPPWRLSDDRARLLIGYLLDEFRVRYAIRLPDDRGTPRWSDVAPQRPPRAFGLGKPGNRRNVHEWGSSQSAIVTHFLHRLLQNSGLSSDEKRSTSKRLMEDVWHAFPKQNGNQIKADNCILLRAEENGTFQLNPLWLRVKLVDLGEVWQCDTCASLSAHNIGDVCPRNRCSGCLSLADESHIKANHYRLRYENLSLPPALHAEEHTAQINNDEAQRRQERFKNGETHLLSSSTTFELGVDLGDLEVVFLRNVPPQPFNYTQRAGRAGRRDTPGLVLTYCRRNPHDLYHYENPKERLIEAKAKPPRLQIKNEKIILRHMVATALSAFFKASESNRKRFATVKELVADWSHPRAVSDFRAFCENNNELLHALSRIVPEDMHECVSLSGNGWIDDIAGPDSRFSCVETEVCEDYKAMDDLAKEYSHGRNRRIADVYGRIETIECESTLNFLSRKAVIPKYGFPVDVVELDTRPRDRGRTGASVSLQRDLSQAIAEYAPGSKVMANKQEWESYGVKMIPGKTLPACRYRYDNARNFERFRDNGDAHHDSCELRKYISPVFGFVTPLHKKAESLNRRTQRLYTTRPFFGGFKSSPSPVTRSVHKVQITEALPGALIILCEGRNRRGFYVCQICGRHMPGKKAKHESPSGSECNGTLENVSFGYELVTDVVRLQFPKLTDEWDAYSVAYAILLGAAEVLDVPDTDLNVTITGGKKPTESAIVLYDNVPGGAGLVAHLKQETVFDDVLRLAQDRVKGGCGCDASCYGCLRSYRNQFAHPYLDREKALTVFKTLWD